MRYCACMLLPLKIVDTSIGEKSAKHEGERYKVVLQRYTDVLENYIFAKLEMAKVSTILEGVEYLVKSIRCFVSFTRVGTHTPQLFSSLLRFVSRSLCNVSLQHT